MLPRDRQPERQHPPGPPRSRLTQARSVATAEQSRGRTTERKQTRKTLQFQDPRREALCDITRRTLIRGEKALEEEEEEEEEEDIHRTAGQDL